MPNKAKSDCIMGPYTFIEKTAPGRLLLYAVTEAVGRVSASKQLFTMRDFKRNEGLEK